MLRIFASWKTHRPQPGLNPQTLDFEADSSMLLIICLTFWSSLQNCKLDLWTTFSQPFKILVISYFLLREEICNPILWYEMDKETCLLLWHSSRVIALHIAVSGLITGKVGNFNKKISPWDLEGWWSRTSITSFCSKYTWVKPNPSQCIWSESICTVDSDSSVRQLHYAWQSPWCFFKKLG